MFSRFGRTVTCAGQTDKHGAIAYIVLAKRHAVKKNQVILLVYSEHNMARLSVESD